MSGDVRFLPQRRLIRRMDWDTVAEALRYASRPANFFVFAFFTVLGGVLFWPYSAFFIGVLTPFCLVRAWKSYRRQMETGISKFPPLCREDWRRARSKLKKAKP
jgi:hypothetical protein